MKLYTMVFASLCFIAPFSLAANYYEPKRTTQFNSLIKHRDLSVVLFYHNKPENEKFKTDFMLEAKQASLYTWIAVDIDNPKFKDLQEKYKVNDRPSVAFFSQGKLLYAQEKNNLISSREIQTFNDAKDITECINRSFPELIKKIQEQESKSILRPLGKIIIGFFTSVGIAATLLASACFFGLQDVGSLAAVLVTGGIGATGTAIYLATN